jgi:hypothetical protein
MGLPTILRKPSFNPPLLDQRVIQDRRSHPTSFLSILKHGGRRKGFRRKGEARNQYVDLPSFRSIVLVFSIFVLSTLDATLTIIHLENGALELNPLMGAIIERGLQSVFIIKSLGIGVVACFLAIHQNFKISFYGLSISAMIYTALLVYHLACFCLFHLA